MTLWQQWAACGGLATLGVMLACVSALDDDPLTNRIYLAQAAIAVALAIAVRP